MRAVISFLFKSGWLPGLLLLFSLHAAAQNTRVSGVVQDQARNALAGASIFLFSVDSSLADQGSTNRKGAFDLSVRPGEYRLRIRYLGFADYEQAIRVGTSDLNVGVLRLTEKNAMLNPVDVKEDAPATVLKGDTTEFNSKAFKTNPDATAEDLLAKMPGITMQNGKVQAQGEDVKQVTVDGQPFLGDDPNAALRNLPAEIVDRVQVFDRASDQSQFTGFDDGNTSKTINIVTKTQFRNGTFGRFFAGYGTDETYKAGGNLNVFKDQRRLSVLAQANNINEQNFSNDDLLGVLSGSGGNAGGRRGPGGRGGGRGGRGQNAAQQNGAEGSDFLVDQRNGITATQAFGINYSGKWREKTQFAGSYFFNHSDNDALSTLFRQYLSNENSGLVYAENSRNESLNNNHRLNIRLEHKLDTFNSILFQPRLSAQQNSGASILEAANSAGTILLNDSRSTLRPDLKGLRLSAPLLLRHRFGQRGRTLSLQVSPAYNSSDGVSEQNAVNRYFSNVPFSDSLDQHSDLNKKSTGFSSNLIWTELLKGNRLLLFNYALNLNNNDSDKQTFNTAGSVARLDTLLSNIFDNQYLAQSFGLGIRMRKGIANLSGGLAYQWASLSSTQQFPRPDAFRKNFQSILPNAMLQFRFSRQEILRINYRTANNPPGIDQLQNVVNNNNPLLLSAGNPDLKQDFQHTFNVRYSKVTPARSTSFFVLLGGSVTQHYVGNSTYLANGDTSIAGIFLAKGAQLVRPENLDGYFNLRAFANYGVPISKIKTNLNLNAGIQYTRTPGLINGARNEAQTPSFSLGVVLSSNISEKVDFTISSNSAYSLVDNSLQKELNTRYFNQNTRARFNLMPWKGLVLQSDLTHQFYSGLSAGFNQNFLLWNAGIGYKFLKDRKAEIRLSAFDLLGQNANIQRSASELYIEDARYNALQRYFMVSFTYQIKQFKAESQQISPTGARRRNGFEGG